MTERVISQDDLEHIVKQDAEIIISAGPGDPGVAAVKCLFEEFRQKWQPNLSDKEYTALFKTYSNWVLAAVRSHYGDDSATRGPAVGAASIQDGDEIPRPDSAPMSEERLEALLKQAKLMADDAASDVAAVTRNGGDGNKLLTEKLNSFLRVVATHKPNEDEGDRLIKEYKAALLSALQREVDSVESASSPLSTKSGCLGLVVLFALTPLATLLAWAHA